MPENIEPLSENAEPQESQAEIEQHFENIMKDLKELSAEITACNQARSTGLDQLEQGIERYKEGQEAVAKHIDSISQKLQVLLANLDRTTERLREVANNCSSKREDTQQFPLGPY